MNLHGRWVDVVCQRTAKVAHAATDLGKRDRAPQKAMAADAEGGLGTIDPVRLAGWHDTEADGEQTEITSR